MPKIKKQYQSLPGYLIRRVNQLLVARFYEVTSKQHITPVQWVALCATHANPGMDQITLSRDIALDTSTVAGVIDRLEIRGLIERKPSPLDKRVKLLFITKKGLTLLNRTSPTIIQLQDWLLSPLTLSEKKVFIKSLQKLIDREDEPQKDLGSNSKKNKPSKLN